MNLENFYDTLQIMWQGMAGIFIVIILIALIVMLLPKLTVLVEKVTKKNAE